MKIWAPAFLIPLGVIAVVAASIIGLGELLLALYINFEDAGAVTGGVIILGLITLVAFIVARRVEASE
jgi:hypothetical protein